MREGRPCLDSDFLDWTQSNTPHSSAFLWGFTDHPTKANFIRQFLFEMLAERISRLRFQLFAVTYVAALAPHVLGVG
jgi:hypothetical protein